MSLSRRLSDRRPEIVLVVLVGLSFASLIAGARAGFIADVVRKSVSVTAYPFVKSMDMASQGTDYVIGMVFNYDRYRGDNDSLRRELATMKAALANVREMRMKEARLEDMLRFARDEPRLALEPARVLETYKGILKIDRGSRHGITQSMAIIHEDGVVGIVIETDLLTATVATVHHVDCRIGAMVQRNRMKAYDGIIHAGGSSLTLFCTMDYIDLKDDVRVGDLVVTSAESVFPSGYPVGMVTAIHESGALWKTAEIEPAVDPYRLDEVFVVLWSSARAEDLEGPLPPEPVALNLGTSAAQAGPDTRSLQERFAP